MLLPSALATGTPDTRPYGLLPDSERNARERRRDFVGVFRLSGLVAGRRDYGQKNSKSAANWPDQIKSLF